MKKHSEKLPQTPKLTVDIVIALNDFPKINSCPQIVLIERRYQPLGWAIPGGFVEIGETVEQAAIREAKEETCLNVVLTGLLGVYSDPSRDTRMHTVSVAFMASAFGYPIAADDAKAVSHFPLNKLPDLVFDHQKIINDYKVKITRI